MQDKPKHEEYAIDYYERIVAQFEATHGELTPAADAVIRRAAMLELLAIRAATDIDAKGLRETVRNGRQSFLRENKSLGQLLKITGQQTSLLQSLKLLPSRKASSTPNDEDNEDGDEEDELSDY